MSPKTIKTEQKNLPPEKIMPPERIKIFVARKNYEPLFTTRAYESSRN